MAGFVNGLGLCEWDGKGETGGDETGEKNRAACFLFYGLDGERAGVWRLEMMKEKIRVSSS
jgi:hypothetical protein